MFKISKFEALLKELEVEYCPDRNLKPLYKLLENDNVYAPLLESYLVKRLENNIHPERLLNLAYYFERSIDTHRFSKNINKRLASKMIRDDENFDQFQFMYKHDTRVERHVLKGVLEELRYAKTKDILQVADKIGPFTGINKHSLILQIMEESFEPKRNSTIIMADLEASDQYLVLVRALQSDSPVFASAFDWTSGNFQLSLEDSLYKDGEQDQFAIALGNTNIPISEIASASILNSILKIRSGSIPNIIDKLFKRAEQEEQWEYLLTLGSNKNKKEVLRSIVKSKDQLLIDKFFALYKNHPEVKHLVPFM